MKHPDPEDMDDGVLDQRGDALPYLSKSAKNRKMDKLLTTPMPSCEGETPGSDFWTKLIYWICNRISKVQFRSLEASGIENIPIDRGSLCCAWHTNGVLDALQITLNHPRYFVLGARHDLVTRPMLGWWTRRMAVQPVVRKAELLRGGCTEEEANFLNGRSLMTLASGIANGYGCVLFPEGTSHNNSYMLRFRTGPMRTVLAAGALAATSNKPLPVLIPLGLHFRQKEHFRTDVWVEYGKPIQVESEDIPQNLIEAVRGGTWSEPPAESVYRLRDNLREKLVPLSPDVNTWEEYRGLQLLGHVKGRLDGNAPKSWSHEVKLARHFREHFSDENRSLEADNLQPPKIAHPLVEKAEQAADILHNNGLDGRDLNDQSSGLRRAKLIKTPLAISRIALFLLLSPVFLLSLLPQIALGRILGDSTDEGIDARTSYQFLAAMFGSITIWPISSTIIVALLFWQSGEIDSMFGFDWTTAIGQGSIAVWSAVGIMWLLMFPVSLLTGRLFSLVWDDYVDLRGSYRRARFSNSDKQELASLLGKIKVELADFD
jgi:1-acyl-sn-glycerol-3-phosphate acyltransferase